MANPAAEATMLIRRPAAEVFDAFVDPDTITKFWLESTTGPLVQGAQVKWQFLVPGATEVVHVRAVEHPRRLAFDWSDGIGVALTFEPHGQSATRVRVEVTGFKPQQVEQIVNATEGFSIVLCDLKTLLETGRSANLVRDKAELIAEARP